MPATGSGVDPRDVSILGLIRLRLAVGSLGERANPPWWNSRFLRENAAAFLDPVFGTKKELAQYVGVIEAARRVHDERIGVGRVFHLFRLTEAIEQSLLAEIESAESRHALGTIGGDGLADDVLPSLKGRASERMAGPVRVGTIEDALTSSGLVAVGTCYRQAFDGGLQCFPYFSDIL
jgi:hypothetical protein